MKESKKQAGEFYKMTPEKITTTKYELFNAICKNQNAIEKDSAVPVIEWGMLDLVYYLNSYKNIVTLQCCAGHEEDYNVDTSAYITFAFDNTMNIAQIHHNIILPISSLPNIASVIMYVCNKEVKYVITWKKYDPLINKKTQDIKNIFSLAQLPIDDFFVKSFYKKIKTITDNYYN